MNLRAHIRLKSVFALIFLASSFGAQKSAAAESAGNYEDFAAIESSGVCPGLIQDATGPQAIQNWEQEMLDRLYACLTAGPIPVGFMEGSVILANGGNFDMFQKYILAKLNLPIDSGKTKKFAESIWKGKNFKPETKSLLNQIGTDAITIMTTQWPHIRIPGNQRFPAKVFCGTSLLDGRRESIVIDYFNSEDMKADYVDSVDWIAGKKGLKVRDEVRMVRPGFYLGRAYMDRVFALNFTLFAGSGAGKPAPTDTCWPGEKSSR